MPVPFLQTISSLSDTRRTLGQRFIENAILFPFAAARNGCESFRRFPG